jgi:DNA-binding MarR family transcriptional regulator
MSRDREELLQDLGDAVRANQRATDAVDDAMCRLLGVNHTDGTCLVILEERGGPVAAGELARELHLTTGAITSVIDRLERAGYARRVPDPADRRRVLVEATDRTRELTVELIGPMIERVRPAMDRYSDADLEMLIEFHRRGTILQFEHAEWLRERFAARGRETAAY